jgi:hypothetical protein
MLPTSLGLPHVLHCSAIDMKRALSTGIVLLFAAIVAVAVISTTRRTEGITALLTLDADGMPDISHIQTGPATPAQIAAQMKKDGLSLHLFSAVRTPPPYPPFQSLAHLFLRGTTCNFDQCFFLRHFFRFQLFVSRTRVEPAAALLFAVLSRLSRNSLVQCSCLLRTRKLTWKYRTASPPAPKSRLRWRCKRL